MDENPYVSPQTSGGFQEELEAASAKFVLDARMLDKEAYRLAELSGCGSSLAITVFMCVSIGTFVAFGADGGGPAHPIVWMAIIIGTPVVTHVLVNRCLARTRIGRMEAHYDIVAGDSVSVEVTADEIRFESERVRWEWPMKRVQAICMRRDLTFVIDNQVTIPVPRNADCGDWDFASFIAICAEQQRRYRNESPLVARMRRWFQRKP